MRNLDWFSGTDDWLRVRADRSPNAPALIIDDRMWDFGQLDSLVSRLSNFLIEAGVREGDHIGLLMPNSLAAVCCIFGLARVGAVLVPLNTRLTAGELAWQVNRAECSRLFSSSTMESVARDAVGNRLSVQSLPHASEQFEQLLSAQSQQFRDRRARESDSLQGIVFTSGTAGFPKGAMITFANHYWSAQGSVMRLGTQPEDRWLACLPLYHVGGLAVVFRSCLYGTAIVLHNGFDLQRVMASLLNEAITIVSLVPIMLVRLLREGLNRTIAPSLRLVLCGGAAASPRLLSEAAAVGLPVAVTYGLTEAASQVATLTPDRALVKPGSAGKPLTGTWVRIIDEAGDGLPPNTTGEIVVAGPTVMAGYYGDPLATAEQIKSGWLHTGDMGYLDEDGDLWVIDRRSDLIISGGENIYPAEVERVLQEHPKVSQVCVVGLPHPDWGQQVVALIVPQEATQVLQNELLEFSREHLAGYKQPRVVYVVDHLPLTGPGKVNRRAAVEKIMNWVETT